MLVVAGGILLALVILGLGRALINMRAMGSSTCDRHLGQYEGSEPCDGYPRSLLS